MARAWPKWPGLMTPTVRSAISFPRILKNAVELRSRLGSHAIHRSNYNTHFGRERCEEASTHARAKTDVRELQQESAPGVDGSDDLHIRMHVLQHMRHTRVGQCLLEL